MSRGVQPQISPAGDPPAVPPIKAQPSAEQEDPAAAAIARHLAPRPGIVVAGTGKAPHARQRRPRDARTHPNDLSAAGHAIAAIGPACSALMHEPAVIEWASAGLFEVEEQAGLRRLAAALDPSDQPAGRWSDDKAAQVVRLYIDERRQTGAVDIEDLARWVCVHVDDVEAVRDCVTLDPPQQIKILRRLPKVGSQKIVFLATWTSQGRQVVLKKPLGPAEQTARIVFRESQTHPFQMGGHPNIIDSYVLANQHGDIFLVEEHLNTVLDDQWRSPGTEEAANLLFDIANALSYIHDVFASVHGDVKPDNIGLRRENYVLLDFGLCRPIDQFAEVTPTGSLRTRAPELLLDGRYDDPRPADIWALCASVFNAVEGRFPLFEPGETPARVSNPAGRQEFEQRLATRARDEWSERVTLRRADNDLARVLCAGLERSPTNRPNAQELREMARRSLGSCLRTTPSSEASSRFSVLEEAEAYLSEYGPRPELKRLMPVATRRQLKSLLLDMATYPILSAKASDLRKLAGDL